MKKLFDVLGLGTVAVDELIFTEKYPPPDAKTRATHVERQLGGLTAIPLITAARLGAKCAYAGMLGQDELSQFAIQQLRAEKINLGYLRRHKEARPVHSFIIVDSTHHTRNVFSHRSGINGPALNWPPEDVIAAARMLFVDHHGLDGMIRAARLARKHGVPVVADFERVSGDRFAELVELVDHLILSETFAKKLTGESRIERALKKLWRPTRQLVAITQGVKGCRFMAAEESARVLHQAALHVKVVDTTGCGDVFHGAYAAALARGFSAQERIRFASGAAALKATRTGAQLSIPTAREVRNFLRENV